MSSAGETDQDVRVDKILELVMALAGGDLDARGEQSDQGDSLDALVCGINMLAEEIKQTHTRLAIEKEKLILAQRATIHELSTPVLRAWEGVLVLPLVGVVDTWRAQQIIDNLLEAIVESGARVAILDITGVPLVDTNVAGHFFQTIQASRMLGAEVVVTGVSAHNAQTLARLGVDFAHVVMKGSLQDGLEWALKEMGRAHD